MRQRSFPRTSPPNYADRLPFFRRKTNIRQRFRPCRFIRQADMREHNHFIFRFRFFLLWRIRNLPFPLRQFKHAPNPVSAGNRFRNRHNQICKLNQLHQNLPHIIHQSHHFSLRNHPSVHLNCPLINQPDSHSIHQKKRHRIHKPRNLPHKHLHIRKHLIPFPKRFPFLPFQMKRPNHPHTRQIFPRIKRHRIQSFLNLSIQRNTHIHHRKHHRRQQRNCSHKKQRRLHINRKRHSHSPDHNKRRTQKQPQHHIHAILNLIHVTRHTSNQRRSPRPIQTRKRKPLNMPKQRMTNLRPKPTSRLRRKILRRHRTNQPNHAKQNHNQTHLHNIIRIPASNPHINHRRHHQRRKQLKNRLQHLKQRRQHALLLIFLQINQKMPHRNPLLSI